MVLLNYLIFQFGRSEDKEHLNTDEGHQEHVFKPGTVVHTVIPALAKAKAGGLQVLIVPP